MIKIEDTEVMGFRKAIEGMRNAMDSWDKSDSYICDFSDNRYRCCGCRFYDKENFKCNFPYGFMNEDAMSGYVIGEADMELAKRLIKAGSSDRKFMRMIHVQADVTAPLYWWKEYDTYKVGTTANSCSTMHTIHKKEFTLDDFSHEHLIICEHNGDDCYKYALENYKSILDITIEALNTARRCFLKTRNKEYWWQMIQLLPSSFNQTRTIDLDYETLFSIYHQRKNHKLDEWHQFCDWIESLPYMKEFLS